MGQAFVMEGNAGMRTRTTDEVRKRDADKAVMMEQLAGQRIARNVVELQEEHQTKSRPGVPEDCHDRCRANYGRQGKYLLPESLQPNDYYANTLALDQQYTNGYPDSWHFTILPGQPHYSKIPYDVDLRVASIGVNPYEGARPWRCVDRVGDWYRSLKNMRYVSPSIMIQCALSETGQEPDVPYTSYSRHDVEFFVDRIQRGMLRVNVDAGLPEGTAGVVEKDRIPAEGPYAVLPEVPMWSSEEVKEDPPI